METWKDIPGYEGLYEASDKGRIRTKEGKTTTRTISGKEQKRVWKSRVLKIKSKKIRDPRVTLWKDKKPEDYLISRLVGTTFIPNPEEKPCINHIDGNPKNNEASNLEWVTYSENMKHSFLTGLHTSNKGVVLENKVTGEKHKFISMSRASSFLGKNKGYISAALSDGKTEVHGYKIRKKDFDSQELKENATRDWTKYLEKDKDEKPLRSDNTSGFTGVYWLKNNHTWEARINVNKESVGLGYYKNKKDAIKARKEAEEKYFKPILIKGR